MRTDTSYRLEQQDAPEVRIASVSGIGHAKHYISFETPGHDITIWGDKQQIAVLVSQFQSEHAKRLTQALRVLMGMNDASDEEVQLAASVRMNELREVA